jgi:subtilisin family serine protease
VRVLGDYGVGSLSSIIAGFKTVFDLIDKGEAKNSTVLINMSLTLNSPLLNDFDCGRIEWRKLADSLKLTMDWHKVERAMQGVLRSFLPRDGAHPLFDMLDPARKAARALIQSADYHLRLIQPLVFLCDAAESRGIRMVAAAGNDSVPGRRLPARYPAAYPSVIGVGALQKNRTTAPYSDESDQPLSDGILTFGGGIGPVKVDACGCEVADTVDGVLGLYVGRFPDGSPSTNGWAYWSGTSFAAPVVTGTIARHCLGGADPGSVKSALMASGSTEHQMRVDQG